jgi:hypothetical protein
MVLFGGLYGINVQNTENVALAKLYRGLKKTLVLEQAAGERDMKVGKNAFNFAMYQKIANSYLRTQGKQGIFGHLFHIFCWNLMCSAGNCVNIMWDHISWSEDALIIKFAHMKNDKFGEEQQYERHIYANPLNPVICPILSLGLYLLCFGNQSSSPYLFPGNKQYDRSD